MSSANSPPESKEHAKATLHLDLLNCYGYNAYLNPAYPNEWRESWMQTLAFLNSIDSNTLYDHLHLLRGHHSELTNNQSVDEIRDAIESYLLQTEHSVYWKDLQGVVESFHADNMTKRAVTAIYTQARQRFLQTRLAGNLDYFAMYETLYPDNGMKLTLPRLTAEQAVKCQPMQKIDPVLYSMFSRLRDQRRTHGEALRPLNIQGESLSFFYACEAKNEWLPPRNGRHHKVWSRLTQREILERKYECTLYYLASCGLPPSDAGDLVTKLDFREKNASGSFRWSKIWNHKVGYLDCNGIRADDLPTPPPPHPSLAVSGPTTRSTENGFHKREELESALQLLYCLMAERRGYTRATLLSAFEAANTLPVTKSTQTVINRAIDKLMLMQ